MSTTLTDRPPNEPGPAWEIARLFPDQGCWDEWDYLALDTNHLVELADGHVEVLPMPTPAHQRIVVILYSELHAFVAGAKLGEVLAAPMPVRLRPGRFCEPDVIFMAAQHEIRKQEAYWEGADLVMEVVSDGGRERDLVRKRTEYADGGIREYWIVDPKRRGIIVLKLEDGHYVMDGKYSSGQRAKSALLSDFEIEVDVIWDVERDGWRFNEGR